MATATVQGCDGSTEPRLPNPPPALERAGALPSAQAAHDVYDEVLSAALQDRETLHPLRNGPVRTLSYTAPASVGGDALAADYRRATAGTPWTSDPSFAPDPRSRFAGQVWSFGYRAGARFFVVIGVKPGPMLRPVDGRAPIAIQTNLPDAATPP